MVKFRTEYITGINSITVENRHGNTIVQIDFRDDVAIHPDSIELAFTTEGFSEFLDKLNKVLKLTSAN